jgi:hypothetical protein
LVRCNTYRSKNPYGDDVSHLRVICPCVHIPVIQGRNDRARSGEYL